MLNVSGLNHLSFLTGPIKTTLTTKDKDYVPSEV